MVQNPHSVQADTHDYFLPRPGRLSSKSGADMIISCGDLRLVGSHRKVSHSRGLGPAARWGGVPKVAPELLPWPVFSLLRRWGGVGVVFQKVVPESSMGWCSKSWGDVPKSCPRIPTARWGGVPKVGVVFQRVVPESPLCILLTNIENYL